MKRLRNEKGAITMITLITILFMVSFLMTSYMLIANKVKTQKEMLAETQVIYEPKSTMEEIYNSYIGSNLIPIYTVEHLLAMGTGQQNVNINGKYYNFNNDENIIYVLMNDLEFKASDYEEQLSNGYWLPVGDRILAYESLTDEELEDEELVNSQFKAKFEGKNNDIEIIYVDENNNEYSRTYSKNKNYCETYRVGDYVNYTPDTGTYKVADGTYGTGYTTTEGYQSFTTEEGTKWRILSIDELTGEVELVSETGTQELTLQGADGYNHGVDILNDLCSTLYSKTLNGEKVAKARSIKVEDVNEKTTYDYTTYIDSDSYQYGITIKAISEYTSKWNKNYANLYEMEEGYALGGVKQEGGLNQSEGLNDGVINSNGITEYKTITGYTDNYDSNTEDVKKDIRMTYTYYEYVPEYILKDLGINTAPIDLLIIEEQRYWFASRHVQLDGNDKSYTFGLFRTSLTNRSVKNADLFNGWQDQMENTWYVRPVIALGTNTSLKLDLENSTDSVIHWNLDF